MGKSVTRPSVAPSGSSAGLVRSRLTGNIPAGNELIRTQTESLVTGTMGDHGLAVLAARDLLRRGELARGKRRRILPPMAPPSLRSMREALRRAERPMVLSWILLGALVTVGVMLVALVGAVYLGHRMGVDFAAVDRSDSGAAATGPLVLIGGAALSAFPIAGWLVAKASRAQSVIEVAISAILAILGTLVLLGLAAPVAVVFAIAFAPIAFGLACVGAWLGLGR